jgi:hypothetical protein
LVTVSHQEIFDVLGGTRNLAIAANAFYSENAVGGTSTTYDYQNTTAPNAYIWDFRWWDNYNNRKQMEPQPAHRLPLVADDPVLRDRARQQQFRAHRRRMEVRAFTGSATTVPNATTTGVVPGQFTDYVTVVRPVTAANIDVYIDGPRNYYVRTRQASISRRARVPPLADRLHRRHRLHATSTTATAPPARCGCASQGAGWILDRSKSDLFPTFIQNGGPDIFNPDNYRPTPTA